MPTVNDNPAKSRYELPVQSGTAFVLYRREPGVIVLTPAEVPAHLSGRELGGALVAATLKQIRAEGGKVAPRCSFVRAFMAEHPEFDDLRVPPGGV